MKTIKVSELIGAALDWAVAQIEKPRLSQARLKNVIVLTHGGAYAPSTNWAQGGPIIEREGIYLWRPYGVGGAWSARLDSWQPERVIHDDKPLIAAMRCYVASKLGDTVEVPEELAT